MSMAPAQVAAQTTVYETEEFSLDVGLDAAAVVFIQNNPWFGEAEANIGVDTDGWTEFAIEPQLYLTVPQVLGGELTAGVSLVGTKTIGESGGERRHHITFWRAALAFVVGSMLILRGIDAIRITMIIGALPFSFVVAMMAVSILKAIAFDLVRKRHRAPATAEDCAAMANSK
ncbi:hypothetical protein DVR09_08045 [Erythrobacter aureus]|uniref:Uncharacterized protein n=2 Tax=Erythrobacter aureus TaxID=2182384 RepID=A0A345YEE3_9SPHN|nr:hypothetical protein DVR09_08045 [Erythrobacter aureus]